MSENPKWREATELWKGVRDRCVYRKPYPGLLSEESVKLARSNGSNAKSQWNVLPKTVDSHTICRRKVSTKIAKVRDSLLAAVAAAKTFLTSR